MQLARNLTSHKVFNDSRGLGDDDIRPRESKTVRNDAADAAAPAPLSAGTLNRVFAYIYPTNASLLLILN